MKTVSASSWLTIQDQNSYIYIYIFLVQFFQNLPQINYLFKVNGACKVVRGEGKWFEVVDEQNLTNAVFFVLSFFFSLLIMFTLVKFCITDQGC